MKHPKVEFILVSPQLEAQQRIKLICDEFKYSFRVIEGLEALMEEQPECSFLLIYLPTDQQVASAAAEMAQAGRYACADAFIVCAVGKSLGKDGAQFAKRSGANLIVMEEELFNTAKLEFIANQVLRAQYLPIKAIDMRADTVIPFDVFHLLPQRQKFLPFVFTGDVLDQKKRQKIQEVGEIYINRKDAQAYKGYVAEVQDMSAQGLSKRCRAQFLALYTSYSSLVFMLTDQSEVGSFGEGEKLLKQCKTLCAELLGTLAEFGNAWDIINNSTIGEFGSVERAPAIASYAALFSLQTGMDKISDIMLAALLSDLGLLFLPSSILKKIREDKLDTLTADERAMYQKYPLQSLEVILDRKLAIEDKLRKIIISVKERIDGKGFPKGTADNKVPIEAQMIQFSWDFDRKTLLRLGMVRPDPQKERDLLIQRELAAKNKYAESFLLKMEAAFKA